jgi:putative membrane protein insertion efficiency factor
MNRKIGQISRTACVGFSAACRWLLMRLIDAYAVVLSPHLGGACRFHPSCSAYAREAIEQHGALRGSWLALRRLMKCGPWHPGGHDPVPLSPHTND